jgi:F-box protein 9
LNFSFVCCRDNVNVDIHGNDNSENNEELIDSIQRVNLDDGELSTICKKNFPQQVDFNLFILIINKENFVILKATHISSLPSEVLIYIFRWVVSSELDVRSLEQCARVCRGFYICARDPQLWKMICFKTWTGQTGNPSANINWRHMFINRPHVVFNGR